MNLARSLAEPTLTTLNGQPANFNVGGSFPVPVVTGQTAAGLQGVEFQQYGVQLNFVPIVTDHDRIRLTLQANVSTRDESAGTQFGESDVPGLNSRTFQNTVELREGETIAVAGLIQTNVGSRSRRMPFLGDLPFVRRLFSNDGTSYDEQELIVLVTPYLVNPVDTKATPIALPGSDYYEPDDVEFFLKGSLTGHLDEDYRSPVRTDIHKMKAFRRCEQKMIIGQPGHSNGLLCPPGLSAAETSLPAYSGVQP
jgi:pilus assembly protein CpaC